jgi:hypothetical protein
LERGWIRIDNPSVDILARRIPMVNRPQKMIAFSVIGAAVLLLACNLSSATAGGANTSLPGSGPAVPPGSVPTSTAGASAPSDTPEPSVTPNPTATYTIVHLMTPVDASGTTRFITDLKTKDYADKKKAIGGDDFSTNRYERPFTAKDMAFLPDVDLTRVEMRIQSPWVYITFTYADPRAEGIGQTMYGAEFDTNKDGRGEYLVWGASPPSTTWTTNGVEVWQDTNHDVGGPTPQVTNAPWNLGDGYDKNLVSSGQGDDPDLAWIRQIEGGAKVQLAFKYSAIGSAPQFLWNGLADAGVRNPKWMDYNDHFTQAEAGSPYPVQTTLYPLNELYALDNTCRDPFGFTPTGTEAGLCEYYGSISGTVFRDYDENGVINSGEPGVNKGTVLLGQGACPSSGFKTAGLSSSGAYAFSDLLIGTYCVSHSYTFPNPSYHRTTPGAVTVHLAPGDAKVVNFGISWLDPIA